MSDERHYCVALPKKRNQRPIPASSTWFLCSRVYMMYSGELSDINSKPLLINNISLAGLKEFHFGHDFTLLRTSLDTTRFVGFGSDLFGQLGDGSFQPLPVLEQIQRDPARNIEIKQVRGGSVNVSERERERERERRKARNFCHIRLLQMATGYGHTLLLSEDGRLFAWGLNAFGQLGHGDTKVSTNCFYNSVCNTEQYHYW